eukprot:CAMPEP_0116871340 /NCGR_PEP_ID=MMETSP0463-20121206/1626_1 /TAXON_ID=181622 /ORGANISM="Strombidinopsis sp, Strain SopsisLIS2011" /LENGTH=148 /DNA_ID=CAMNT_0004509535 /DNA_START=992 /DNA_END=1438 /DNA_ORIENTATION=+
MEDDFYSEMALLYKNDFKKHKSPTRRLMDHREAAYNHKLFRKSFGRNTRDYQLMYNISPKKSCIVQPHDGEIDYDMAQKSPKKFYHRVLDQEVTEHVARDNQKVKRKVTEQRQKERMQGRTPSPHKKIPLEVKTFSTKRGVGKIYEAA